MDDFYLPPLDEPSEEDFEPSTDQQAFAAYEEAWAVRDTTGSASSDLLVAALRRRNVRARAYAPGTRLHRALFDSWNQGRRPKRMHGVILKYRLGKLRGARIAGANTDTGIELPAGLRPASRWSLRDEEKLPFRPTGLFATRLPAWYEAAEDDDDDDPERYVPVWLDTSARPEQTPVMIGRELAGHTDLPAWVHQQVLGATKRGRRVVVTGDLPVKRRKDGTYKVRKIEAELPKRRS